MRHKRFVRRVRSARRRFQCRREQREEQEQRQLFFGCSIPDLVDGVAGAVTQATAPLPLASISTMALQHKQHRLLHRTSRAASATDAGAARRLLRQPSSIAVSPSMSKASVPRLLSRLHSTAAQPRRSRLKTVALALPRLVGKALGQSKVARRSLTVAATALVAWRAVPAMLPWLPGIPHKGPPQGAGARRVHIMWFRSDLRLHDNEALTAASDAGACLLPVYVFDPREFGSSSRRSSQTSSDTASSSSSSLSLDRTGIHRARFLLESVAALRQTLRARGSDLIVRVGHPEQVLPRLAQEVGAAAVHCHSEPSFGEARVEAAVCAALRGQSAAGSGCVELRGHWGGTLHAPTDLPFELAAMPGSYAEFRSRTQGLAVRAALPCPPSLKGLPLGGVEPGPIPTLTQLGFDASEVAALLRPSNLDKDTTGSAGPAGSFGASAAPLGLRLAPELRGGEAQALAHMRHFLAELRTSSLHTASSQGRKAAAVAAHACLPGGNAGGATSSGRASTSAFSCQVSPWLAAGCLSPRLVYQEAMKYMPVPLPAPAGGGGGLASGNASNGSFVGASGGSLLSADSVSSVGSGGSLSSVSSGSLSSVSSLVSSYSLGGRNSTGVGMALTGSTAGAGHGAIAGQASGPGAWLVLELMWRDFFRFITHKYTQASLQGEGKVRRTSSSTADGASGASGALMALA